MMSFEKFFKIEMKWIDIKEENGVNWVSHKYPTCESQKLAEKFNCSRTQAQQNLKNKDAIFEEFKGRTPVGWKKT